MEERIGMGVGILLKEVGMVGCQGGGEILKSEEFISWLYRENIPLPSTLLSQIIASTW